MRLEQNTVVAIVGYRNAGDIRHCLSALSRSAETRFAISICENGGAAAYDALIAALDGLVEPASETPAIIEGRVLKTWSGRLLPHLQQVQIHLANANLGYAGGVNVCIRQIDPSEQWSAVWVLNPDTEPHTDALGALIERVGQGYDIVGSRLVYKATNEIQSCGCRWRPIIARGLNLGTDSTPQSKIERGMNYASGASLFVTRDFVENVGLMDERYFLYCEEIDWCLRRKTRRIGCAYDSVVYHIGSSSIGDSAKVRNALAVYLDERNRLLLTRRFYPWHYPIVVFTTLGVLTIKCLQAGLLKNFLVALSGWWAGIRGEVGPPVRWMKP